MAFYDNGYMWPQEHTTYDPLDYQDSVSFSSYEPHGLDSYATQIVSQFQDPSGNYDYDYDYGYGYGYGYGRDSYSCANPDINYYAYNYVEPKLLTYESAPCDVGYISYHTEYSVSYSKADSGFNEPEFEEYDPTPYDGGYDIISVYGKPLPPSDKTCYPRSKPKQIEPISALVPSVEAKLEPEHESGVVHVPVVVPQPVPAVMPQPIPVHVPAVVPQPIPVHVPAVVPQPIPVLAPVPLIEPEGLELEEPGGTETDEYNYPDYRYDYPWPEYDNGNRIGVGCDYGYGKQVVQIPPYEYDPYVVDLCENIFGSWPCLARIRNQQIRTVNKPQITCPENGHYNPLEECASYIFGRPVASYNQ